MSDWMVEYHMAGGVIQYNAVPAPGANYYWLTYKVIIEDVAENAAIGSQDIPKWWYIPRTAS